MIYRLLLLLCAIACYPTQATAQVTVTGKIMWQDRNGVSHALRGAKVEIWNNEENVRLEHPVTFTDGEGAYGVLVDSAGKSLTLFVKVLCESTAASVHPSGEVQVYEFNSSVHKAVSPGTTHTISLVGNSGELNDQAFSVLEAVTYGQLYADKLGKSLDRIDVNFPIDGGKVCGGDVSCFRSSEKSLNILLFDRWDWDVVMHEYGHNVSSNLHLDENPGGMHYINANLEDYYDKDTAVRLAWGEGWPTFFSISAQRALSLNALNIPNVGDSRYTDTEDSTLDEDLASQSPDSSMGEDNELSVSRILYYLFSGASTVHGTLTLSDKAIWNALTAQPLSTLSNSWQALTFNRAREDLASIGIVYAEHLAAPTLLRPVDGVTVDEQPMQFEWKANGGGKTHPNSLFRLFVFDANWNVIIDSGDLTSTTYRPTKDQWDTLRQNHMTQFHWTVTGSNRDKPATGPYSSYAAKLRM